MAHKTHPSEQHEQPSERRHRSLSEKDSEKLQNTKRSKSKITNSETKSHTKSRHKTKDDYEKEKLKKRVSEPALTMEDIVPELSRTSSRNSLPYPAFNKAHSKESVRIIKDNIRVSVMEKTPLTPVMTDLDWDKKLGSKAENQSDVKSKGERPPSPPETDIEPQKVPSQRRMSDLREYSEEEEEDREEKEQGIENEIEERSINNASFKSALGSKSSRRESKSKSSVTPESPTSASTRIKNKVVDEKISKLEDPMNISEEDPNITKLSPKCVRSDTESSKIIASPTTKHSSCPSKTSSQSEKIAQKFSLPSQDENSNVIPISQNLSKPSSPLQTAASVDIPRINYLLQNGGLHRPVPKKIVFTSSNPNPPHLFTPSPIDIDGIFGPCQNLLDKYLTVLEKQGSLAVATGYRSVARRLLDRLEVVMGRVLSPDGCSCLMCHHPDLLSEKKSRGLGWGEVLEWSAGRKELPPWPAFDFGTLGIKALNELDIHSRAEHNPKRPKSPIKIDPDIADEFRQYYLQQSKKTKLAVDKWLSSCKTVAAAPPQEVDDETLSFSILTHLPKKDRPIFNALVTGSNTLQPSILAPVFLKKPRSEFLSKTGLSIQRLYKLTDTPRVPEIAIFLLQYPKLHNLLATLSQISNHEWEILISGRFDGFLWSGADPDLTKLPHLPCHNLSSRSKNSNGKKKPFSNSKSPHISSLPTRLPVLNDEETEIAVLAEIDREIYQGMETLEDAFEALHRKAELVRRALRERGASLTMSLQSRRLSQPEIIGGDTSGPPKSGLGLGYERPGWSDCSENPYDSDWEHGDDFGELAPDDSASNISSSKLRRPKHKTENKTPVVIEEDNEEPFL